MYLCHRETAVHVEMKMKHEHFKLKSLELKY